MYYEVAIRFIVFIVVFLLVAFWERRSPRRPLTVSRAERWFNNLGIIVLDSLLIKWFVPVSAVAVAAAASIKGWGFLHLLPLPYFVNLLIAILVLDLIIYLQHLMFHAVPVLWRLHMVHHADLDLDVTSGLRFHPLEIIFSMLIKIAVIAALGPPVAAVIVFEIALNGTAMFNHGNIFLPEKVDKILRFFIVTPDMHRVHHSVLIRETNSNFGFNFPWWDRLCGTYRAQPVAGHEGMVIGLSQYRKAQQLTLVKLLLLPFAGSEGRYSIKYTGGDPESVKRQ